MCDLVERLTVIARNVPDTWGVGSVDIRPTAEEAAAFIARQSTLIEEAQRVLRRIVNNPDARIGGHIRAEAIATLAKLEAASSNPLIDEGV